MKLQHLSWATVRLLWEIKSNLYPNPGSYFITVSYDGTFDGNYTIINALGQTVVTENGNTANEKSFQISISNFKNQALIFCK